MIPVHALVVPMYISVHTKLNLKRSSLYDISQFNEIYRQILGFTTLDELYEFLYKMIVETAEQMRKHLSSGSRVVVKRIIDYLNENYSGNICLDDLSKVVFMNPRYICRILKNETGKTYHEILTEIRINKAKEFLPDLQFRMYKIAEMVGFGDTKLFSHSIIGVSFTLGKTTVYSIRPISDGGLICCFTKPPFEMEVANLERLYICR